MYTILVFVFFVTFDLAFWVPCWWDLPARECQAFWCLQAVKVAPPVLSLCDYSVQIFAHWLHFWNLPLLQVVFAFSHHGQMGAGAISLPDRGYLGEIGFNYLPAEPQTPRSPHPPDNFCQILLARQEALDGEGQWSRGWEEFQRYIWSASVFFLPFLLFESWVLISAANFNATWQSMHCNVWEYSLLPALYNCQRKAGTRHGQSITSVNRDVGLFVQYIIVLNIQLLFPPASLQFGSCHHFAIF